MSTDTEKIEVTCPQCARQLRVPAGAIGKQGRCPGCGNIFPLEAPLQAALVEPAAAPTARVADEDGPDYSLQPLPPESRSPAAINPYPPATAPSSSKSYNHGFGWEHRGWDAGLMGGLAMMALAAVWFVGGLAFGIIFYYPPILFVIGLVGFVRGLFTGNVSGR
jgi:hypothetical protein